MHDVAVALDRHEVDDLDAAGLADPAEVVAAEVDEHQVLGALLGVGHQLLGEGGVGLRGGAARAGAGDGVEQRAPVLDLDQRLGAGADDVEGPVDPVGEAEEVHVRARVGGPQDAVDVERGGGAGRLEPLRRHHLEGLARADALLDVVDGRPVVRAAPAGGELGQLGGRQGGGPGGGGAGEVGGHRVEPGDGVRVRLVDAGLEVVVVDRVGDQQDAAVPVVEDGEVRGEEHGQLGQVERSRAGAAGVLADLLQAADDVVAEVAHHAAGEGRQSRALDEVARGVQRLESGAQGGERVAVRGDADGRGAQPMRLTVANGQGSGAADADEGVARPRAAVLRGLQQEGARPLGGQLAVETHRRVAVGEEAAGDGDDSAVLREGAEGLRVRRDGPVGGGCGGGDHGPEPTGRAAARRHRSTYGCRCDRPARPGRPSPGGCRRRSPGRPT